MRERRATGYCERCAQRLDLLIPEPGSTDLELRRVEDLIRFCAGCSRYVGRACCWRPDDAACADCAAGVVSVKDNGGTGTDAVGSGAMRVLAEAPAELTEVEEHAAASAAAADRDRAVDAWEDAWLEAGTLSARVDSAGGAVVKRVAEPAAAPGGRSDEPRRQLRRLMQASAARREAAVRALAQAGTRIASRFEERIRPRPGAPPAPTPRSRAIPRMAAIVVIVLLAAVGVAAIGELQRLDTEAGATPGPERSPLAGGASDPSPTVAEVQTVAETAFDLRVLGPLTVEPPIVRVDGSAEVAAFPTSFDRSLRLTGPGLAGLCVDGNTVRDAPVSVAFDLMQPSGATPPSVLLTFAPGQTRESFEVGQELLSELQPGEWFGLEMTWEQDGSARAEVQPRDGGDGVVESRLQAAPEPVTVDDGAICIWLLASSAEQSIFMDNLVINQP